MYAAGPEHYFTLAAKAVEVIRHAMAAAKRETFRRILDCPCGHGRVLRALKAEFPRAELTACDLDRDGVDFCAKTFGATPIYSKENPIEIELPDQYDLIWCGSLFTHFDAPLWHGFLKLFGTALVGRGILVFTTHGRFNAESVHSGYDFGVPNPEALLNGYERQGFGYVEYPETLKKDVGILSYGVSLSSLPWVITQAQRVQGLRILSVTERAWGGQDVIACFRESLEERC
jgi:SAM-dependent methyltransferase